MKTKTYFAFGVDLWDSAANSILSFRVELRTLTHT
jgi:hypothetical protein